LIAASSNSFFEYSGLIGDGCTAFDNISWNKFLDFPSLIVSFVRILRSNIRFCNKALTTFIPASNAF